MVKNNICKFVTTTSEKQIFTTEFVLENELECLQSIHHASNYSMRIVVQGKGKLRNERITGKLQPGTVFFTFPETICSIEAEGDFSCMYIGFYGQRAQELFERYRISPENCIFEGYDGLLVFWQNCLGKANAGNLDLISESVLLYTFAQLSPPSITAKQRLVDNIREYIEKNFNDPTLSLNHVADCFGYHPKYVSNVFKKDMGISFTEHVTTIRIQYAVFLMENGITTVKNLALLCGFTDPYYFSNVFKAVMGMSPAKYIDKIKGNI